MNCALLRQTWKTLNEFRGQFFGIISEKTDKLKDGPEDSKTETLDNNKKEKISVFSYSREKRKKNQHGMICMWIYQYGKYFARYPKTSGLVIIVIARWFFKEQPQSVKNSESLLPRWNVSDICRNYCSARNVAKMVTEQLLRQLP